MDKCLRDKGIAKGYILIELLVRPNNLVIVIEFLKYYAFNDYHEGVVVHEELPVLMVCLLVE